MHRASGYLHHLLLVRAIEHVKPLGAFNKLLGGLSTGWREEYFSCSNDSRFRYILADGRYKLFSIHEQN